MTDVQVFKWFCKEQGIMANIRGMYYVSSPLKYMNRARFEVRKLTFNEWIHSLVVSQGFRDILVNIAYKYNSGIAYSRFDSRIPKLEGLYNDTYKKAIKRWGYFVKNNIVMNDKSLKVGDIIAYKNPWDFENQECEKIVIDSINLIDGYANGHLLGSDASKWQNERGYMRFDCLKNPDDNKIPIEINYSIKRNRRIYNGVS